MKLMHVLCVSAGAVMLTCIAFAQPALPLNGRWAFQLDAENKGLRENWELTALPDSIELPGSTDTGGFGVVNNERRAAYLSRLKEYTGPAWYQREVSIPADWAGRHITLFLERCHWETRVWADGQYMGMQDSLCTPHVYDLSAALPPGPHRITIRVDNTLKYNVGINAHSVTEHTQTNWNGMIGRMELRAQPVVFIQSVQTYPDTDARAVRAVAIICNSAATPFQGVLQIDVRRLSHDNASAAEPWAGSAAVVAAPKTNTSLELTLPLGDKARLWDEFSPVLYELTAVLIPESAALDEKAQFLTHFGLREIGKAGTHTALNGRPIMIRGTLECCIFPLTGFPATDIASWRRMYAIARSHGLNHLRFHSWCPPEAAFDAADEAGFTLQVETPVWTELGSDPQTDAFIQAEAERILDAYGNHPSFCMMAVGNEPSGPKMKDFLNAMVSQWQAQDPRRLYTTCAGWPELPVSDYHVVHQRHNKPYRLHSGPLSPDTRVDYHEVIQDSPVPVIAHELGQWCVYPSFEEIPKYSGVLRPRNFEVFRESLAAHHMLDQAGAFSRASGALQTLLYKADIEAILRTPGTGGFQLLQLQDFPGQGSALMGFLDAFWDSKGYCSPEQFREFCSETVPLLRMAKYIWKPAETFSAMAEIAHFGPGPIQQATPQWKITSGGKEIASGTLPACDIPLGNGMPLGKIAFELAALPAPAQYEITLALANTPYRNRWPFWVYPADIGETVPANVLIAQEWNDDVRDTLDKGGNVLLLPAFLGRGYAVPSAFEPVFWNMQWFPGQRRQLGLVCDPDHPAFAQFPTDSHTNWQWWDLLNQSRAMNLDAFPLDFRPFLQVIDDWNTNRRLGYAFEAKVSNGNLLVCALDLVNDLNERPAARQLRHSLLQYMAGGQCKPAHTLDAALIAALCEQPAVEVVRVDHEASGYEGYRAADGDPATLWHTPWGQGAPTFPHEIQLRLKDASLLTGLRYLPRQDIANGRIARYEIYLSANGQDWGRPVAKGTLKNSAAEQEILFDDAQQAQYVKFIARSDFDKQPFVAIAELTVLSSVVAWSWQQDAEEETCGRRSVE